jgi:hypothetical protein
MRESIQAVNVVEPIGAVTGENMIGDCEKMRITSHAVNGG